MQTMGVRIVIFCILAFSSLYAEKNWIPIQPIPFDSLSKTEKNLSKAPTSAVENIKRLQRLLDKQNIADSIKRDTVKNWYLFEEPAEN